MHRFVIACLTLAAAACAGAAPAPVFLPRPVQVTPAKGSFEVGPATRVAVGVRVGAKPRRALAHELGVLLLEDREGVRLQVL